MRPWLVVALAAGSGLLVGMAMRRRVRRSRGRVFARVIGAPRIRRGGEAGMDEAVEGTFPASDPPACMGALVTGAPRRMRLISE